MADILTVVAAIEWIVAGALFFWGLRRWNKKFEELYEQLKEEIGNGPA